jgi:hypothetical protein
MDIPAKQKGPSLVSTLVAMIGKVADPSKTRKSLDGWKIALSKAESALNLLSTSPRTHNSAEQNGQAALKLIEER